MELFSIRIQRTFQLVSTPAAITAAEIIILVFIFLVDLVLL